MPGRDTSRDYDVAKLIDVTTCIGCKACEVACLEWNGYPFRETVFDNTYQTMPDLAWNYYNLIRFNEHVDGDGTLQLADAQGPVHALRRSRLPAGVPGRRRHRAVLQRHRRFPAGELHRLPVLRHGLSVQHSEVQPRDQEGPQVHALFGPRGRGTGTGLHQGLSHRLPAFRQQGQTCRSSPSSALQQLREHTSHKNAGVYDPAGVGGTHVMYVLHDIEHPERYGGLPKDPQIPLMVRIWKGPLKWLGNLAMTAGIVGVALHYVRFGPKRVEEEPKPPEPKQPTPKGESK